MKNPHHDALLLQQQKKHLSSFTTIKLKKITCAKKIHQHTSTVVVKFRGRATTITSKILSVIVFYHQTNANFLWLILDYPQHNPLNKKS